jgi:pimeloyl-ACP methyl ester carboxylesterase
MPFPGVAALALFAASLSAADFRPCTVRNVEARCGIITVLENRAEPGGRKIGLNVVIVPATGRPTLEALFILQGGPGQAATTLTDFYAEVFAGIRGERDIVLIDQRGTGGSNGLKCDMGPGTDLFPSAAVAACANATASIADPRYYTTAEAVADLDYVRQILGMKRINLYGTSYGVRVALEYIRKQPQRVRSVIVKGTVPPALRYTVDPAIDTQRSLERVMTLVPSLRGDLEKALASLPVEGMTRELFAVELRNSLHSVPAIATLTRAVHDAANGHWAAFTKSASAHRTGFSRDLYLGMYFSVTCTEDIWRVSADDVKLETARTIAGDYWYRQLAGACDVWPHAAPHREVAKSFRANAPALIISGAFDPVTPPRWGAATAAILPRSRHLAIETASHSFAGLSGCIDKVMTQFVIDPDPKRVDASCVDKLVMPVLQ